MTQRTFTWPKFIKESILIYIFGGGVNALLLSNPDWDQPDKIFLNFYISGFYWVMLWKGSELTVDFLDRVLPWLAKPVTRSFVSIISVILLTLFVVYFMDIVIDMLFLKKSFNDTIRVTTAPFWNVLLINGLANLFMHGRGFLFSWRQAAIDNERLKTEQVATQYNSLKNQVNPHFLFNSFNALSSLVYEDQDKAVEFIRKLSQVYRYVLDRKDEELVPLTEEMDFVRNFVYLQQIRFGDNLIVEMEGDESNAHVPPLAIQLLVENAIKHNVVSEKDPLKIQVLIADGHCIVQNSLKEKKSKDSTGIGLDNLIARYEYLSDKPVEVTKTEVDFKVTVPLLTLDS